MLYTKYFSGIIRQYGRPNLSAEQFRKFMNIVHLEGRIAGINTIKRMLRDTPEAHRFDVEHYKVSKKLTELTGNLPPEKLKEQLFRS